MKYSLFRFRKPTRAVFPLTLLTGFLALPAHSQDSQQRLNQMEARLDTLQKQMTETSLEKTRFNGFFSTGYTRANNAGFDEATEDSDLQTLSLFGLQATWAVIWPIPSISTARHCRPGCLPAIWTTRRIPWGKPSTWSFATSTA
jgi:hypothetical protein